MSKLLKREVRRFGVKSLATGVMVVEPIYHTKPIEPGATPIGVLTRILIAEEIQRLLNKALK